MKNAYFAALAAFTLAVPFAAHAQNYTYDPSFSAKIFVSPHGMRLDSNGNIYVADQITSRVAELDSSGKLIRNIGVGSLKSPSAVAVDSKGIIYVADTFNYRVAVFTPDGKVTSIGNGRGAGDGQFNGVSGLTLDGAGNVYVDDQTNARVEKFDSAGNYLQSFGSKASLGQAPGDGQLFQPAGVNLDKNGNLYVADQFDNRIVEFAGNGKFLRNIGLPSTGNVDPSSGLRIPAGNGQLNHPGDVAFDSSGNIFVVDTVGNRVAEFSSDGAFIQNIGNPGPGTKDKPNDPINIGANNPGSGPGQFTRPISDAIDSSDNLYVSDQLNGRIERFVLGSAVPEPGALALLAAGLAGGTVFLRRRRA